MKEKYESLKMSVTEFDVEDVITTSDRNNSFYSYSQLNDKIVRDCPVPQTI